MSREDNQDYAIPVWHEGNEKHEFMAVLPKSWVKRDQGLLLYPRTNIQKSIADNIAPDSTFVPFHLVKCIIWGKS